MKDQSTKFKIFTQSLCFQHQKWDEIKVNETNFSKQSFKGPSF